MTTDPDRCFRCSTSLIGVRPRLNVTPSPGEPMRPACSTCAAQLMPGHAALFAHAEQACRDADFDRTVSTYDSSDGAA